MRRDDRDLLEPAPLSPGCRLGERDREVKAVQGQVKAYCQRTRRASRMGKESLVCGRSCALQGGRTRAGSKRPFQEKK